jgi:hypothetical protein
VQDQGDACSLEIQSLTRKLPAKIFIESAVHGGEIDASLFEDGAIDQDARASAAASLAGPEIFPEVAALIEGFEAGTNPVLKISEIVSDGFHRKIQNIGKKMSQAGASG